MSRIALLASIFLLISLELQGQCVNGPTVALGSTSGSTCKTTPVTVTGNTFGGSATKVTITDNGSGSVSPTSASKSPFTFTYTPKNTDSGKTITITVTTNNPLGSPCNAAKATYSLTVNASPATPTVGTITKPTCTVATGSVVLNSLPSTGTWTITRNPGGITTSGTGTSVAISGLEKGTYTFTVTTSEGCTSPATSNVVIPAQPLSPASPLQTTDCSQGIGKAVVKVTSPTGEGLTYSLDGGAYQSGTSFSNVGNGSHSITAKNSSGCTATGASFDVTCGCLNPPTVTLSSNSGSTCSMKSVTISGNTFGGSATGVTLTVNGAGTVSPVSASSRPFSFTYTPATGDAGKTVLITVTTNNPEGFPCAAASAEFALKVADPSAPVPGQITQPTCTISTGSVILTGLLSTGTWTLTRSPDGATSTGSGASTTITDLPAGIYTYTVTSSAGCVSPPSAGILINAQPVTPAAPFTGPITVPACASSTGSVALSGLPGSGNWILTRFPGQVTLNGSGTGITISGLPEGSYYFTLTTAAGCVSVMSEPVIIPAQPESPSPPIIGTITQPVSGIPTGTVVLNGLPENSSWALTLIPGNLTTLGTGETKTISGLPPGNYNFIVANSAGCTSGLSEGFAINAFSATPRLVITDPAPVCINSTADLTDPQVTAGSDLNLTYTYWADTAATIHYRTPDAATSGTYFIKGSTTDGFFSIKPVTVQVMEIPRAYAGPDQDLVSNETTLDADLPDISETGAWSIISGTAEILDPANAKTPVSGLSKDKNIFLWTVTNGVCPATCDTVMIMVHDLVVPTLITPNMDGKNDYFLIRGSEATGRIELIIFNRRGVQIYNNENYDNSWNGVDYKGNPVPEDTYFYILRTDNMNSASGYIVIRR